MYQGSDFLETQPYYCDKAKIRGKLKLSFMSIVDFLVIFMA